MRNKFHYLLERDILRTWFDVSKKKHCGRFCIQFNLADDRHIQVIELLESKGHRKAQFIAEAVV